MNKTDKDEGNSWSKPQVIYDYIYDNRDPHISQLSDDTVDVSFFSLELQERSKDLLTSSSKLQKYNKTWC